MAPEYIINGQFSAWKNWREGTAMNLIDPNLGNSSRDEMMRCIHIGLLCVQENVAARPTMNFVVLMLSSSSTTLPVPTQPAFTTQTNFESDISFSLGTNSSMSDPNQSRIEVLTSQNEASITKLYPR
ncbi:hypothetical protein COLO4_31697 [Corchorus olitorius]|uniref:Uncharacterized protein n=1 Tax=Corchorus olitorius TaxID=93759 RepID=A0A1R3H3N2_9ROSI|nr:hypothetical protein COLO4_31697 [Corchorus olitorius]